MDVKFFPVSLGRLEIEEDLRNFMTEVENIYRETGMPMFPCIFHHFCLPFSPICAAMYCASQRKSKLDELIHDFNNEKGKS